MNGDINIIGFSLTGFGDATSFGHLLQKRLEGRGQAVVVREISYGGLSVNALAGLIADAIRPANEGDWVGLELATSFFSLQRYSFEDALPYVFYIVRHLLDRGHEKLFFLNLYRRDLDDNDCVVQAICAVAGYFGVPILDLKKPFRQAITGADDGTTDGIHPAQASRERIAEAIDTFLLNVPVPRPLNRDSRGPSYRFVEFSSFTHASEVLHYNARGKQMTALVLPALERLEFNLGEPSFVVGYCFLYGPETGFVQLCLDNADTVELITYDEHSYYRRIGFRPVQKCGQHLKVTALAKTRDIALVRPSGLTSTGRKEFVCGVILKDETHKLPADLLPPTP